MISYVSQGSQVRNPINRYFLRAGTLGAALQYIYSLMDYKRKFQGSQQLKRGVVEAKVTQERLQLLKI